MPFLYRTAAVLAVLASMFATMLATPVNAQTPERRFALVIGNSEYKAGKQPTAANDAGLIAESLRAAGFDVAGARDLDQDTLRRSIREFLDKVAAAGPQAVTFVYLAGYGLQFEGENYIVPVDASIRRDEDIPIEAIRISDFTRPLAGTPGSAKLFIVDAARQHPFMPAGPPLASGLALVEPDPGMLIAFNAAPGSIAPIENGPYGAFAQSLAEMIGTGGLGLDDVFARLRLRVNEKTNGLAVPWYASKIERPFLFMERTPDAPPPPQVTASMQLQSQPIREFRGDQEAYVAALERDTLGGYEEFVAAFPDSPLAPRVRALMAVRREAITWRRTVSINTPEAYWSYLRRYPQQGAHVPDAERRLARLAAAYDPPPAFAAMAYDVGPPPPDEVVYLSQPAIVFDGPGFYPPPPIPAFFLPPPPPEYMVLAPPPPPIGAFFLPAPVVPFFAERRWGRPPAFVQAPPAPVVQQITINNTTIIRGPGGGAAQNAAALPANVVTRVNSGALRPPPPAPPAPPPIHQTAALTGTGTLGNKSVTLPPPQPRTGPLPAAATTGPPPAGQVAPGVPRPPGPATATTTPGAPPAALLAPGVVRPGPATATTTPGVPAATPLAPGAVRPGPATATATPGVPPAALVPPAGSHPAGPNTATVTPGSPPTGRTPPGSRRPTGPTTATTTPAPTGLAPGATPPAPHVNPPAAPHINAPVAAPPPPPRAPQVVSRPPTPPPVHAAPPPPPAVHAPPPPPPAARAPAPPPQAAAKPPAPAKKCVVENGKQVCK